MNKELYKTLHAEVVRHLEAHELWSALCSIENMLAYFNDWQIAEQHRALKESYSMMLRYMLQGTFDPDREAMHNEFMLQAFKLSDSLHRRQLLEADESYYKTTHQTLQAMTMPHDLTEIKNPEISLRLLFDIIYSSPLFREEECDTMRQFLASTSVTTHQKAVAMSALTLATLTVFDEEKLLILLTVYADASQPTILRARSLVGIVLILNSNPRRCHLLTRTEQLVEKLFSSDTDSLVLLQLQLIISLETKKIADDLQGEIFPHIAETMKPNDDQEFDIDKMGYNLAEAMSNPDWENGEEQSKLARSLKKIVDKQQRGADIYMGSFAMLKQRFPFFDVAANWFAPFSPNHPDLKTAGAAAKLVELIASGSPLCDSDKYSFSLLLQHMSTEQVEHLQSQFGVLSGQSPSEDLEDFATYVRTSLQDIYRFFKLFRYPLAIPDPFAQNILLTEHPMLGRYLGQEKTLRQIADFAFEENNWDISSPLYDYLTNVYGGSATMWQKRGFIAYKKGNYEKATASYERADLMQPGDRWTLQQLLNCYQRLRHAEKAYDVMIRLGYENSEQPQVLLTLAKNAFDRLEIQQSIQQLQKAAYYAIEKQPEDKLLLAQIQKALAEVYLYDNHPDKAWEMYQKAPIESFKPAELLQAAHATLITRGLNEALTYYQRYLTATKLEPSYDVLFRPSAPLLAAAGFTLDELILLADAIAVA